jgi:hypothetical protein
MQTFKQKRIEEFMEEVKIEPAYERLERYKYKLAATCKKLTRGYQKYFWVTHQMDEGGLEGF